MLKKQVKLDLIGLKCPVPVLKLAKKIREINIGNILKVEVDDPKPDNDFEELAKNINIKIPKIKEAPKAILLNRRNKKEKPIKRIA